MLRHRHPKLCRILLVWTHQLLRVVGRRGVGRGGNVVGGGWVAGDGDGLMILTKKYRGVYNSISTQTTPTSASILSESKGILVSLGRN